MAFRRTEHCKETSAMPPHLDTGLKEELWMASVARATREITLKKRPD
jgi:hypothetical protein